MKLIIFFFIISITSIFAQGYGLQLGYSNIGTNYGYVGLDARITKKLLS